jgi:hypothetical protein
MTGTGRVKGFATSAGPLVLTDGVTAPRNVEVIFDPDNPMLKKKVGAWIDTNAKELWELVQLALADQRTISYRIESQRRKGVDRTIAFVNLDHAKQVNRILAGLSTVGESTPMVMSHEAKTDPSEDPDQEHPSALGQNNSISKAEATALNPKVILEALAMARQNSFSTTVIDTIVGNALSAGATMVEVNAAGFNAQTGEGEYSEVPAINGRTAAIEERPWVALNSDGRPNPGSYMVSQASTAEQFALDHLIGLYSGKKSSIDVTDKMISQAASLAAELLKITDEVQVSITQGRPNRQKNSYPRALALVIDAVSKRYPAPLAPNAEDRTKWHGDIVAEASERFYGIMEVAHGRVPMSLQERTETTKTSDHPEEQPKLTTVAELNEKPAEAKLVEPAKVETSTPSVAVSAAAHALGAKIVSSNTEPAPVTHKVKGDEGFIAPSEDQISRVKGLCEKANLLGDIASIGNWLERTLGTRISRNTHAPALEAWLKRYESMDIELVRGEALPQVK